VHELTDSIAEALGDFGNHYDTDAIAEALRRAGCATVDAMSSEDFWQLVAEHELPQDPEPSPQERFTTEVLAAVQAERPIGQPARWQRGGVQLEIEGFSRVSERLPQPTAVYRLTVAGQDEVAVHAGEEIDSWAELWALVQPRLEEWSEAVTARRRLFEHAQAQAEQARAAATQATLTARRAQEDLNALLPAGQQVATLMSKYEVAEYLGIAPGSVARQMSRWEIEAEYVRGASGRSEARYPAEAVRTAASSRPGQGRRTDLHRPTT
jgi:hypothetical protein